MIQKKDMINTQLIDCSICLKEIPESEAKIFEAQDYLQYYCGLECYQQWQEKMLLQNN